MNKKISKAKLTNLVAQTNFLSSLLQAYQSMLVQKFYHSEQPIPSRKFSSEGESEFAESDIQNKDRSYGFQELSQHPITAYLFSNHENYQDHILEQEMQERPTGYPRDEQFKKTKEKIDLLEESIQACHGAIQKQLEMKQQLEDWNLVLEDVKEQLRSKSQLLNQVKMTGPTLAQKGKSAKGKNKKKCE